MRSLHVGNVQRLSFLIDVASQPYGHMEHIDVGRYFERSDIIDRPVIFKGTEFLAIDIHDLVHDGLARFHDPFAQAHIDGRSLDARSRIDQGHIITGSKVRHLPRLEIDLVSGKREHIPVVRIHHTHEQRFEVLAVPRSGIGRQNTFDRVVHRLLQIDIDRDHDIVSFAGVLHRFLDSQPVRIIRDLGYFLRPGQDIIVLVFQSRNADRRIELIPFRQVVVLGFCRQTVCAGRHASDHIRQRFSIRIFALPAAEIHIEARKFGLMFDKISHIIIGRIFKDHAFLPGR